MQFFGLIMPYRRYFTAAQWFLLFPRDFAGFVGCLGPAWFCCCCHGSCWVAGGGNPAAPQSAHIQQVRETSREIDSSLRDFPLQQSSRHAPRDGGAFEQRAPSGVQEFTAEKKLRVRGSIVAMSPQRNLRGRINCIMLLLPPLNCDLWRSS